MTMSQAGQAGKDVTKVQIEMHSVSLNVASVRKTNIQHLEHKNLKIGLTCVI